MQEEFVVTIADDIHVCANTVPSLVSRGVKFLKSSCLAYMYFTDQNIDFIFQRGPRKIIIGINDFALQDLS